MVDQLTLQTMGILLTGLTVSIAAIYYMLTLRYTRMNMKNTLETRQAQLTMQLFQSMTTKEYLDAYTEIQNEWTWNDYDDFMSKYGPKGGHEKYVKFGNLMVPWEQIGILMKHKSLDPIMVYDQWGGFYRRLWEKLEPIIIEMNIRDGGGYFEYAEDLYYFFHEARLRDLGEFKDREERRLKQRKELGLKTRPAYK